jgi:hypothetical protein
MASEPVKKRRTTFVYVAPSLETVRQRVRIGQFDEDIIRAHRGDTEGLCDYLRSNTPLDWGQREKLADLIFRRLQGKGVGRPRGSDPVPNPAQEAAKFIAYLVRKLALQRYGDRVPRGKLNELIEQVCQDTAERFDGEGPIRIEDIRSELKRGRRKSK